jgi:hypothetical protein
VDPREDPKIGQPVDGLKEKWKADLPAVKAVLHYFARRAGLRGRQKKPSKGKLEWNKDRKGQSRKNQ